MLPSVPIFDSTSVMTRYFDIYLKHDTEGTPFTNIDVRLLKDNELVWYGTTDEDGKVALNIDFNIDNFDEKWILTTNNDKINLEKTISIYISNPVMINLEPLPDGIHYRNVIHVQPGNPGFPLGTRESPYSKIQEAIDNSGGDVIYVHAGTYTGIIEPGKVNAIINLNDSVSIFGDHPDSTVIDATLNAENVSGAHISGFTILDKIHSLSSSLKLSNNIIRGNTETAIWSTHSNLEIINNTIVYNSADAIFLHDSCTASIRNNIITNNGNWGVTGFENSETIIDYNNIWGNGGNYFEFFQPGQNDISKDPLFANAMDNIYHLRPESPCINAGDPDPKFNDIDGSRNDMGAFAGQYLSEDLPATITIFTLDGRPIYSSKVETHFIEINMTYYKDGVYILNISSSSKNYSLRIIKN
jgi:parallel beta-helix repeat protein